MGEGFTETKRLEPLMENGMVGLTVVVMMNEVGDDRVGRRHESADSSKVEQDRPTRETL